MRISDWSSDVCSSDLLGFKPIYMIDEHPLPWLAPLLNGVEHANFFEQRATEYSKAATRGSWNDVWSSFDKRQKAKAANEGAEAEDDGPGLFGDVGVGDGEQIGRESGGERVGRFV